MHVCPRIATGEHQRMHKLYAWISVYLGFYVRLFYYLQSEEWEKTENISNNNGDDRNNKNKYC